MNLRCLLFGHEGGIVGRGSALHVKCLRCDRLSPGIEIDDVGPEPRYEGIEPNRLATRRADHKPWHRLRLVKGNQAS